MPRCYMVKKSIQRHEDPQPCSPSEACVAPPCYSPAEDSALTEPPSPEYAELQNKPWSERSAADTEAAHDLLSLAHSLPPLPPAVVVPPPEPEPTPVVPLYTYTIHPTNIYILAEDPPETFFHTYPAISPFHPVGYSYVEPQVNYLAYQHIPPESYQPHNFYKPSEYMPQIHLYPQPDIVPMFGPTQPQPQPVQEPEPITEPESDVVIEVLDSPPPLVIAEDEPESPEQEEPEVSEPEEPENSEQASEQDASEQDAYEQDAYEQDEFEAYEEEEKVKYSCHECGKSYATSSNLSRHKQTHRSLDSLAAKRCEECGKVYVSMPALAMHVLTHQMGHVCGVCGKQFSRPWLLRGHLRSHTGEKPYNCEECGKAFADRSNLRAHLQTHSAAKKYECRRCRKNFALKSYLNKHLESTCPRPGDD